MREVNSLFRCPLCAAPLERRGSAYVCPNGHSYDIARDGYVHLLPANKVHSKAPGDDREMAAARNRFLSAGHYAHLLDALCALALEHTDRAPAVLDSGCGEGYYTAGIHRALLDAGKAPRTAGVDLSKPSLRYAARRAGAVEFAVASVYHLPVGDGTADLLVNCFSPLAVEEFRRALRPGGTFLYVVPAPDHLWALKQVLYDTPYPNEAQTVAYDGFEYVEIRKVARELALNGPEITDLFRMTPYCWKTPRAGAERLGALDRLAVRAEFHIHVFQRL